MLDDDAQYGVWSALGFRLTGQSLGSLQGSLGSSALLKEHTVMQLNPYRIDSLQRSVNRIPLHRYRNSAKVSSVMRQIDAFFYIYVIIFF